MEEMLDIVIGMETDEVSAHDPMKDRLFPFRGQQAEDLIGRERDMQEESDGGVGFFLTEKLGQQHKLVVMDPDLVVGFQHRQDLFGKESVNLEVGIEIMGLVFYQIGKIME